MSEVTTIKLYTTASVMLDLKNTQCLNYEAGQKATGRKVRLVEVHEEDMKEQKGIYESNLESVLTEHEWKCELQFGNIIAH